MNLSELARRLFQKATPETQVLAVACGGLPLLVALFAAVPAAPWVRALSFGLCAWSGLVAGLSKGFRDRGVVTILALGFLLYGAYASYTEFFERNYDGAAQLSYIRFIADQGALPPPSHCFICHHPPLYYTLAAGWLRFIEAFALGDSAKGIQLLSLGFTLLFIVYSLRLATRFTTRPAALRIAATLLVFWPYTIRNSVRIHNDPLVSGLLAASLFYTVRWLQDESRKDVLAAGAFVGLSVLTKSNGMIGVAFLGLAMAVSCWKQRENFFKKGQNKALAVAITTVLVALSVGRLNKGSVEGDTLCHQIAGSACDIDKDAYASNELKNYLYFEGNSFLTEPFLLAEVPEGERDWFWNQLIKSSLFGTHNAVPDFEMSTAINTRIATVMNWLALAMILLVVLTALWRRGKGFRRVSFLWLAGGVFVAFLMAFRILIPAPHHADFRHVYPLLGIGTVIYVESLEYWRDVNRSMAAFGLGLPMLFALLSGTYYLPKQKLLAQHVSNTVQVSATNYSKPRRRGSAWNATGNLVFRPEDRIRIQFDVPVPVRSVFLSVDHNDRYELTLIGDGAPRTLHFAPDPFSPPGLALHRVKVEPPLKNVRLIRLRARGGDGAYSLGHLIVR